MLTRLLKSAAAGALSFSGADAVLGRHLAPSDLPLVIGYHRVVRDFAASARQSLPAMLISTQMLSRHLDWLGERFDLVSLDDIAEIVCGNRGPRRGKPPAAVTFDDGYADFYDHAFPILEKRRVPAAIFVVTDLIGTRRMQTHDRLFLALDRFMSVSRARGGRMESLLDDAGVDPRAVRTLRRRLADPADATAALLEVLPPHRIERVIEAAGGDPALAPSALAPFEPLSWSMLIEMRRAGVTVGSHTRSHLVLTNADRAAAHLEARDSRRVLETMLGTEIRHFAYPAGRFDPESVAAVGEAGYGFAYTTCRHQDPARPELTIPRTVFWERTCLDAFDRFSPAMMSCQVHRVFDFRRACRHEKAAPAGCAARPPIPRLGAAS
ncbi:MAG TPA: polysaccharide deacetylase family protein [Verrucomicrobiae bacterium]|nr:polysaccharide deacetylase family protein [Verrucomicrobiae bacterium]